MLTDITERKQAKDRFKRTMSDLKRFNWLAVVHEGRMIELKQKVNDLLRSMGRTEKYTIIASKNIENKNGV